MNQGTRPRVKINGRYVKMEVCPKLLRALREMGNAYQVSPPTAKEVKKNEP